jgi:predicted kinase
MRAIPEGTANARRASETELPTCFPENPYANGGMGLIRFASGAPHEDEHRRRRTSMLRRASDLRKFSPIISTEQCNRDDTAPFRGPYTHLRKELDYGHHSMYRKERQWLQDSIIEDMLEANLPDDFSTCVTPMEPWLLFTVGPRGAGKKHVVDQLVREDRLPLLSFVRVDPDEIRRRLPEFDSYSSQSPCLVDELTRKESGFIAELLLLAALQNGRNVVFDGSMSDPIWHVNLVKKMRQKYEKLRVGMIHITAPTKSLLQRTQKKLRDTGRDVTQDAVLSYTKDIGNSVAIVKPYVDFYSNIHNGPGLLELGDMEWEEFHNNFLQTCAWKPGMRGKQKLIHEVSEEEMSASRHISTKHARRKHRRFSVLVSSEENNSTDDFKFYGKFSHIRETLDYNYHSNYTFERQKLQDAIIDDMLDAALIFDVDGKIGSVPTEPWIVFTAGAMGAGKSHTMNDLVEKGRFPLKAFVVVDPDEIRHLLPEYHMYVDHNPELAGELTRKEAGFIAEILTLAAVSCCSLISEYGMTERVFSQTCI